VTAHEDCQTVRERKIHLASNLQDADSESSRLESAARTKLAEPSLAVSLLPKNVMSNMEGGGWETEETGKRGSFEYEQKNNSQKKKKSPLLTKDTAVNVI